MRRCSALRSWRPAQASDRGLRRVAGGLRPPASRPGLVHRWATYNQVPPNFTAAQAAAAAPSFDLATVKPMSSTPVVTTDENANSQLKVLVYHNGAFAQKNEGTRYPAAWYARTPTATRSSRRSSATS